MFLSAGYYLLAFLVSWLPEELKERQQLQPLNSPAVHVVSGALECMAAFALLSVSFFRQLDDFTGSLAAVLTGSALSTDVTQSDLIGMGALGFIAFFLQPLPFVYIAFILEGVIRIASAILMRRTLGTMVLAVPYRLAIFVRRQKETLLRWSMLGPPGPDAVLPRELSPSGMLEICASRPKPWHENQVLEFANRFYVLDNRQWIQPDEHRVICYRFRPMRPGEIIRGSLVRYQLLTAVHT
jgi:hypothetical protein